MLFAEDLFQYLMSTWWRASLTFLLFFGSLYIGGVWAGSLILRFNIRFRQAAPIFNAYRKGQKEKEVRYSILSILVFSLQAIPFQYFLQKGWIVVRFDEPLRMIWEIPILFLWNEMHFYACHWLLHRSWLLKNVHYIHHASREPTLFSVFSFHWFEAFLLGTVVFFPALSHSFFIGSLISLPIMSIILNLSGHSNHETPTQKNRMHLSRFTFRHTLHHKWSNGNYGFMLPFLDRLFNTHLPKSKN